MRVQSTLTAERWGRRWVSVVVRLWVRFLIAAGDRWRRETVGGGKGLGDADLPLPETP